VIFPYKGNIRGRAKCAARPGGEAAASARKELEQGEKGSPLTQESAKKSYELQIHHPLIQVNRIIKTKKVGEQRKISSREEYIKHRGERNTRFFRKKTRSVAFLG